MRLPEKRKPVAGEATGFQETCLWVAPKDEEAHDSETIRHRQARRLRDRFPSLTWATARVVAELHFGRAA